MGAMTAKTLWLYYLTMSRSILSPPSESPSKTVVFNDLMKSDDSPFSLLPLTFKYNFAGIDTSMVYVSPNGAVHFSKEQPCYPFGSFGSPNSCNFNSSYYGTIGGFLTDLDPSTSGNANISASYYSDRVKVNFDKMEYFGSNLANTFSVSIFSDDHIEIDYTQISKNSSGNLPTLNHWISGLRPFLKNSSVYLDSDMKLNSQQVWHTSISGIYPELSSTVSSGNSFVMCPVTLLWCLRNGTRLLSELQTSIVSDSGASIELVTGKMSCASEIDFGVTLSYTQSGSYRSWVANCTSSYFRTVNTSTDGYGSLRCPLPTDFVSSLSSYLGASSSVSVDVTVMWRSVENGIRTWKSLPLSLTTLSVASSSPVPNDCHCSSDALHGHACNSVSGYGSSPCNGDFSCVSASKCYKPKYARSLFIQPDCKNNCSSATTVTSAATTYISDPNGQCCSASSLDCAGYCGDGNRQGYIDTSSTSNYCCASQYSVDCAGVCGGSKVYTSCGYCVTSSQSSQCTAVPNTVQLSPNNASGVYYISFSTSTASVASRLVGVTSSPVSLRSVLRSDDSPFATVYLPRPFMFNGRVTNRVFVNPNGALHFSLEQPCYPNNNFASALSSSLCTFDNAYYDLIGGFLADLNPSFSQCTGVNITMSTFSDHVDFNFIGFCYYYALPLRNTFSISLYDDDDRVVLNYYSIFKSVALSLPATNFWISGIRPPKQNNYVLLDSSSRTVSRNTWNTAITGVYPAAQSQVSSGRAFVMCPTTLVWCVRRSHRTIDAMMQSPVVQLVTAKLSCLKDVKYSMIYSWSSTHRMADSMFVSCNSSVVSSGGGYGQLRCKLPVSELSSRLKQSWNKMVQMHLWVQWQASNASSAAWTALPMSPVTVTIYDNTSLPTSDLSCDCNYDGLACGTGRFTSTQHVPLTGNTSSVVVSSHNVSYAQSICSGNFTCLKRPCYTSPSSATVTTDRLFLDRDCRGNCYSSLSLAQTYMSDSSGTCCAVDITDCAGLCGRNSTVAYNSEGAEMCCAAGVAIDCGGYCGGGRVVNVCGTCTATDPNGNACFSSGQLVFSTPYKNDRTGLYPVYDLSSYGTMNTVETIYIRNNALVPITVTVNAANANDPLAPSLVLPVNTTKLAVGERANITLPTSIASLFNGTVTQWGTRAIFLSFYRTSVPSPTYSRTVYLYPLVKSCEHLSNDPSTCMRIPGCFFCLQYPSQYFLTTEKIEIRIRRSTGRRLAAAVDGDSNELIGSEASLDGESDESEDVDHELDIDNGGSEEMESTARRRLFSNFVPTTLPYVSSNDRNQLQSGNCIDGWRAEHCRLYRSDLREELNVTALPSDKAVRYLGASLVSSALAGSTVVHIMSSTWMISLFAVSSTSLLLAVLQN